MALTVGTNSYADVDAADAYFVDRAGRQKWEEEDPGFDSDEKEWALVRATDLFEELEWQGYVTDEDQDLAWPRKGEFYDPARGRTYDLEDTTYPKRLLEGLYELAYHILENPELLSRTGTVDDLAIAGIVLSDIKAPPTIPSYVRRKINPLLKRGGSRSVFVGG